MTLEELITDLKAAGANENTLRLAMNCYELGVAKCTRSHPHEEMSEACELRTEIARLQNQLAHLQLVTDNIDEMCARQNKIGYKHGYRAGKADAQRKPLTHEQRLDLHAAFEPHKSKWNAQSILIDMIEAAHNIKGDA